MSAVFVPDDLRRGRPLGGGVDSNTFFVVSFFFCCVLFCLCLLLFPTRSLSKTVQRRFFFFRVRRFSYVPIVQSPDFILFDDERGPLSVSGFALFPRHEIKGRNRQNRYPPTPDRDATQPTRDGGSGGDIGGGDGNFGWWVSVYAARDVENSFTPSFFGVRGRGCIAPYSKEAPPHAKRLHVDGVYLTHDECYIPVGKSWGAVHERYTAVLYCRL